ncbi:hypothetical protein ULT26_004286 [Salmonella enterica]|nr:hypothetical protein [Salmonella enterica]
MNRTYLYVAAFVFVVGAYYIYGVTQYRDGWKEGRAAMATQQRQQAHARLEKQVTRQQQNDTRAAAAEQQGDTRTVTITQEVIKYIKTPGRNVCKFDEARVKLKQAAVDNANHIEGYDHE